MAGCSYPNGAVVLCAEANGIVAGILSADLKVCVVICVVQILIVGIVHIVAAGGDCHYRKLIPALLVAGRVDGAAKCGEADRIAVEG